MPNGYTDTCTTPVWHTYIQTSVQVGVQTSAQLGLKVVYMRLAYPSLYTSLCQTRLQTSVRVPHPMLKFKPHAYFHAYFHA